MEYKFSFTGHEKAMANSINARPYILVKLNETLRRIGHLLTPQIKEETPKGATGGLRNSTVFQLLGRDEDQRLEIRQVRVSEGGFPYGTAVREGTRPHWPPYRALIPWVEAVLGISGKEGARVAFLVARKISRVGTEPNPYHQRVLERNTGEIQDIVENTGVSIIGHISGKGA